MKGIRNLAGRPRSGAEQGEDVAPGLVGEGHEGGVP
jgi:hypothetical protein